MDPSAAPGGLSGWRVSVAPSTRLDGDPSLTVAGAGEPDPGDEGGAPAMQPLVDGIPAAIVLDRRDETRAVLVEGEGRDAWRTPVLFGPPRGAGPDGTLRRELVVDGWRIEIEIENERRAELRERARQIGAAAAGGGPTEVRAIIPGKIVAVDVRLGDPVEAGQRLVVIEAMKMQNELAAPREGMVELVAVEPGVTVDRGELLVVIR